MRASSVAALYDIHANLPALEAVLDDVAAAEVDLIVCGGDVAWGSMPRSTVRRLMKLPSETLFVMGNADREVASRADERDGLDPETARLNTWCTDQLGDEELGFIRGFSPKISIEIEGLGPTLFCHGTPRSDEEIVTTLTGDDVMTAIIEGVTESVIVSGHTHTQFDRAVGDRRWVNAGSIGIPYESEPGAYWGLLGPDVSLRRTSYDFETAAEAVRSSGCPLASDLAAWVTTPAPPDETAAHFERVAGRG